jgi:diguanylate cyclase (GGDEF)-like protein
MTDRAVKKKLEKLSTIVRKIDYLASITRIHLRIGTIFELKKISRIYLRELIDMVSCDACAIIRIEGGKVRILAERGFLKTFGDVESSSDVPAIEYVVYKEQAISNGDVPSSPDTGYVPHGSSVKSLICAPILVNNGVGGIIYLDSAKKNAFNKEDMEFTELLAKEISISFDISSTFEQSFEYSAIRNIFTSDELTGYLNRRKFDIDITDEVASAKEYEEQLSLLMIDIDWFKKYNDFHGHEKGDALLKAVADTLAANTRPYEKIYRYGGEEFVILLPDTDKEKAPSVARRLQKTIEKTQFEGQKESQPNKTITVSIGVATFPSDADQSDKLIETAESALSRAKKSGKNQVCVFNGEQ